jgi:glycosyltransferase involved in cell wall biosynthesis
LNRAEQERVPGAAGPLRILVITPFGEPNWRWLEDHVRDERHEWTYADASLFGRKPPFWFLHAWRSTAQARRFDLVITHHPYMTLWVAFALRLRRIRTPHIAYSFNHGNKRFFKGVHRLVAGCSLLQVALFVVYSEAERRLFHEIYRIPFDRLSFTHWAVSAPKVAGLPPGVADLQPYFCCMGRNNRDFDSLVQAAEGSKLRMLLVTKRGALSHLRLPPGTVVREDISLDESMLLLEGSRFSVVPILDESTGAGHMTIVSAMQLGKPQIVTQVKTVDDYFFDGVHGISVPPRDPAALRAALRRLESDDAICRGIGDNVRHFAAQWLSEEAAARGLINVLKNWQDNRKAALEPPGWTSFRQSAGKRPS